MVCMPVEGSIRWFLSNAAKCKWTVQGKFVYITITLILEKCMKIYSSWNNKYKNSVWTNAQFTKYKCHLCELIKLSVSDHIT